MTIINKIKNEHLRKILNSIIKEHDEGKSFESSYESLSKLIVFSTNNFNLELLFIAIIETLRSKIYKDTGEVKQIKDIPLENLDIIYLTFLESIIFYITSNEEANKDSRQYAEEQGEYLVRMLKENENYIETLLTALHIKETHIN